MLWAESDLGVLFLKTNKTALKKVIQNVKPKETKWIETNNLKWLAQKMNNLEYCSINMVKLFGLHWKSGIKTNNYSDFF